MLARMTDTDPIKHLYLVDGSGYIFRAYFAIPPRSTSEGVPTNATFGFTNMLIKLLRETDADGLAVIFDKGKTSFRNDIYGEYKAQRPDAPEDLVPQFEMIREATRAFNLPCIEMEGFEADDLIATYARLAREAGIEVTVVSSDKDLMQLVGDGVAMLDPMKNLDIGPDQVVEKFGVLPDKVIEVQALAGDSVDNVPGVPGIGIKTAAQLINEYGDLETLLARAEEIKQPKRRQNLIEHAEMARISRQLVELKADVPVVEAIGDFRKGEPDPDDLRAFLERYEFRSILTRLSDTLGGPTDGTAAPRAGRSRRCRLRAWSRSAEALQAWVDRAVEQGVVAVDTETTSLDALQAELVGVSLALTAGAGCYIPLGPQGRRAGAASSIWRPVAACWRTRSRARRRSPPEAAAGGPLGAQDRPEHQVRHAGAGPATRASRWRRSTTPCCCPTCWKAACTATAWTSCRACTWTIRPSSSPRSPAAARPR